MRTTPVIIAVDPRQITPEATRIGTVPTVPDEPGRDEWSQCRRRSLRHLRPRDHARAFRVVRCQIDRVERQAEQVTEPAARGERLDRDAQPVVRDDRPEERRHARAYSGEPKQWPAFPE